METEIIITADGTTEMQWLLYIPKDEVIMLREAILKEVQKVQSRYRDDNSY